MHHFLRQFPILIMMMATHFAKLQAIASSAIAVGGIEKYLKAKLRCQKY